MLRWAPYPFVRITLSFIAGILLYLISGREFRYGLELLAFFVLLYTVAFILSKRLKSAFAVDVAGMAGLGCFVAGGLWAAHAHTAAHQPEHVSKLAAAPAHYIGVVDDYVLQKPGYQSTVLRLEQVQIAGAWQRASGKVQLSVPHDSEKEYELSYGDRLLVKGAPQAIAPSANPGQFDYRAYLANKNIYHRHYLQPYQFLKLGSDPRNPVLYFSIRLRRQLDGLLRERVEDRREYGISSALILGVKDELDNDIRNAYAQTGTMHVLAVSGLHVGLIYGVLMLALARLNRTRRERAFSAILVLAVLWLYAFITGLSPSVLRAVVMFSLVTIAMAASRRTNIYNTLSIAAFGLLCYNPYFLLDVGFQLSFLAVLGIVYLQPRFYRLLAINNWLLDKIWALFTVALAAQLATLPLGLLYFHQFPVYFWLANVLVVPAATAVLYTGVAALALSWAPLLGSLLFKLHVGLIWIMNEFNLWIQRWPQALINGIDITALQAWLLYALLLAVILFFSLKRLRYLSIATAIVAVLAVQELRETMEQKEQQLLTVYSLRGSTALAFVEGRQSTVLADSAFAVDGSDYAYNLQPHLWRLGVQPPQWQALHQPAANPSIKHALLPDSNSLYVWQGKKLLVLQKPLRMQPREQPLEVDYVLLTGNVRVRPEDLKQYTFRQLLLDASNSPWHRQRLQQQLDTLGIPYHDIAEAGAFVVDMKE